MYPGKMKTGTPPIQEITSIRKRNRTARYFLVIPSDTVKAQTQMAQPPTRVMLWWSQKNPCQVFQGWAASHYTRRCRAHVANKDGFELERSPRNHRCAEYQISAQRSDFTKRNSASLHVYI
ncbi:uncharacterized protein LOC116305425 [Actinia tenebrosa]|uniref:Uncharacterized protein LOC116305425 n=1 Tax=Actinia tenebrosa TaxID=6105 RepID=A0A6P8IVZ9_ACTTE|nr:uncharacterized protein LOC116305425 [Actinia tenebrosa]